VHEAVRSGSQRSYLVANEAVDEQILVLGKARDERVRERTHVRDRSSEEQLRRPALKYEGKKGL
jgi:hypothetical protein